MDQVINLSSSLLNTTLSTAAWTLKPVLGAVTKGVESLGGIPENCHKGVIHETVLMMPPNMRRWLALAGLMGASAVSIGAYGAHVVYPRAEIADSRKAVFETANKYHFLHALALASVPFGRKPNLTGSLFLSGVVLFSGSCYYIALTDDKSATKYAPYGGAALILGWLSLAL